MNPKISKLKAERAKNDGKIAMLQSRNREIDEDIIKLENEDIVGLARATGMTMEELSSLMYSLGCKEAYNLDGGLTAMMWYNGSLYSKPCEGGRANTDMFYFIEPNE